MVAQKSKKVAKYTYAERVLGALSQVQKEHRKHAVHLATIRAQVRKSAQEKKDELGPQWSRWVGKAVHKLEADGVLRTADANGGVTFTPNGKKAITAARRSVVGRDGSAAPAQEDMIWRNLSHQLSTGGLKRKQPSHHASEDEEESDEDDQVSTPSKSKKLTTKKARKSAPSGSKTPVSKMTKAELMSELKSLQQAHAVRSSSRVNEMDGGEAVQLRQELSDRDKEIEAIRSELDELKRVGAEAEATENEQPLTRPVTPEQNLPRTPMRVNAPIMSTSSRPVFGVRTQSGSFISAISKQPTPAPSTPGVDRDDDPFAMNDDDAPSGHDGDIPRTGTQMTLQSGFVTPVSSVNRVAELLKDVEKYKSAAVETRKQADDWQQEAQRNFLALQAAEVKYESMLADCNDQIITLQSEINNHQQRISDSSVVISSKDAEISELQTAKTLLESTMALQEAALTNLQHDIAVSHRHIEQQAAKTSILEQKIKEMDVERISITSQMADVSATNGSLSEQFQQIEATNRSLQEEIVIMKEETLQTRAALTGARASLTTANAKTGTLNDALIRAKSVELELRDHLSAEESKGHALSCKVQSLEVLVTELNADLETSRRISEEMKMQISVCSEQNRELSEALAERECTIVELSNSRETAMSRISVLSAEAKSLEENLSRLQIILDSTSLQCESSKGDIVQLTRDVEARTQERDGYATKLSRAEVLQADLAKQVTEYQGTVESLQSGIAVAQNTIQSLRADLESLQLKRAADTLAHNSSIASLEGCLTSTQNEVAIAKSQLQSLEAAQQNAADELQNTRSELQLVRTALEAETVRASTLKDDLTKALHRAHDAEQEATDFMQSKAADEATIHNLKEVYACLRRVQIDSLAELDIKVASAQSSPLPKRQSRSTGEADMVITA